MSSKFEEIKKTALGIEFFFLKKRACQLFHEVSNIPPPAVLFLSECMLLHIRSCLKGAIRET